MDDPHLDGRRDDVLPITRPMDDMDEPTPIPKARFVSIAPPILADPERAERKSHHFHALMDIQTQRQAPSNRHANVLTIVLEVGTFTGFSALAWYEGTRSTAAEIVTLDIRGEVLNFTRKMFKEVGVDDRITVLEGPAAES